MAKNNGINKKKLSKRALAISFIILIAFLGLIIRLSYVMLIKGQSYKDKAVVQWTDDTKIDAKRGNILDRDGNKLAVSADVYRVDLDLKSLRESIEKLDKKEINLNTIAKDVSEILDMEEKDVLEIFSRKLPNGKPINNAIIKRRVEKEPADKIKEYNKKNDLRGFIISKDTKRYYPNNNFASHVIGHTNTDGQGLTGLELYYDKYLAGIPGVRIDTLDAKDEDIPFDGEDYTKPVDGRNVVLTLDENIQLLAEKAAEKAVKDNSAKAASVIIMNPNNGEVLALANNPGYNLNNPWVEDLNSEELQKLWRNRAVSDTFEPGSVFKVITSIAALETGNVSKDETFMCNGNLEFGKDIIHCWKRDGHGPLTFEQIMEQSCNVGFMILGERMGKDVLSSYIDKFGFGKKTSVDLPGEAEGIIKPVNEISQVDLATISFGQSNAVTIMQYMQAFNAVVNGGKLITPHAMKEINHYDDDGKVVIDQTFKPKVVDIGINKSTLDEIKVQLEATVKSSSAAVEGLRIGGKTGTAEKVVDGKYANGKYISSYVGMYPVDNPQVTVLVSIDEPNSSAYYASETAAPIGKLLFKELANYLALTPDYSSNSTGNSLKDVLVPEVRGYKKDEGFKYLERGAFNYKLEGEGSYIIDINPKPGSSVKEGTELTIKLGEASAIEKSVVVPNLANHTVDEAKKVLTDLGLKFEFKGSGYIKNQSIQSGQVVKKGTVITITLEK